MTCAHTYQGTFSLSYVIYSKHWMQRPGFSYSGGFGNARHRAHVETHRTQLLGSRRAPRLLLLTLLLVAGDVYDALRCRSAGSGKHGGLRMSNGVKTYATFDVAQVRVWGASVRV